MVARIVGSALLVVLWMSAIVSTVSDVQAVPPGSADPAGRDAVLEWNAIALQAVADDHTFGVPEQGGPTRASRALAIVHAAIFDAVNSIHPQFKSYLVSRPAKGASLDAAVAQAAHDTLVALYPNKATDFDEALDDFLALIPNGAFRKQGTELGAFVAKKVLQAREDDGSDFNPTYTPGTGVGDHQVDPENPGQGFLGPAWGSVAPFGVLTGDQFRAPPPPAPDSEDPDEADEYAANYIEVKMLGEKNSGARTAEQTEIGLYWAYDGSPGLGVPPRLYNQIARVIATQEGNTEIENARLFALINIAMADAGICSWETKYHYNFWRPIVGIRNGAFDGNPLTDGDPSWVPLGAPASNMGGNDFTPPFPAYTSGHATFGSALFRTLANYYNTDSITFTFVSDELNGSTTDSQGNVRPLAPRTYHSLQAASEENARSRIYLGIHWQFDADEGIAAGNAIADFVFVNVLTPLN